MSGFWCSTSENFVLYLFIADLYDSVVPQDGAVCSPELPICRLNSIISAKVEKVLLTEVEVQVNSSF